MLAGGYVEVAQQRLSPSLRGQDVALGRPVGARLWRQHLHLQELEREYAAVERLLRGKELAAVACAAVA